MDNKTFCFDIDGIIMSLVPGNDYSLARPLPETVSLINRLYDRGHRIILFTARGYVTGIDWAETTRQQLESCGLRYHQLMFGKPAADYYIDDRMISLEQLKDQFGQ
ncbi:MAG: hypothetical protein A2509_04010 [Candidatus Edwardsbacteria bacterium RIFOXYD12_FULL_50_11]|uniref:Phosphoheptose isomerase n=1 Tax=Candidatus Edwardsbacteria bacterium GWF2_54_11 TaxID=1817851 RepID=A0A1F5R0X0_9BACT|nr:MAG: hypothetical protein A2502_05215 [Candidatus Edwardsbacteria bacterium RifOxyC12_full_54_24]OGF07856.1 MAG: hypothetical protein A2273_05170 [Candidatus Edwardsbacteria bacterium RifOxyA12_full_54_48]OGF08128.1 MAG: hypothetical protein A2024_08080 [Candidatus Edwardsbacteria bacterium GWF2_54_11]OGF10105.1 MAG: hypothetical protein A3K15_11585 [Candidatus Edwardsbacteria bacterium GWE2_54_12]OGF15016.1 MAG: hypothetical protein A2509_04010 [Candidatus Edwardsbacteria bacterium RIFOXYD1